MQPTVAISGLHCGCDPAPGVGVVRSLRDAMSGLRLIGIDYSGEAAGAAWPDFDEVRQLASAEASRTAADFLARLDHTLSDCDLFIPGYDPEAWLTPGLRPGGRFLSPPRESVLRVAKPALAAADMVGLRKPESLGSEATRSPEDRIAFCEAVGWDVWAKSVWYGARRVSDADSMTTALAAIEAEWGPSSAWLQRHVEGVGETVAYAALDGELLGAVHLRKVQTTPDGKVWSGVIGAAPEELAQSLERAVRDLEWTGGGELELVRDGDGDLRLLEWNPRFPSWMWAATMGGWNLPAVLIARALGVSIETPQPDDLREFGFTRVVTEIPSASPPSRPAPFAVPSEHPSRMAHLVRLLRECDG